LKVADPERKVKYLEGAVYGRIAVEFNTAIDVLAAYRVFWASQAVDLAEQDIVSLMKVFH
jgi:hypothetical protein